MPVELLCLTPTKAGLQAMPRSVSVVAGAGIEGDRFFARQKVPGQNLTLVEAEQIEHFNALHGLHLPLTVTRRNIVTRGVRLNELVGQDFTIGEVTLRGVDLCEPCSKLARYLAATQLPAKDILRGFAHRAGLRADVLTSGTIACGDVVVPLGAAQAGLF